jgi:hypothetical protein
VGSRVKSKQNSKSKPGRDGDVAGTPVDAEGLSLHAVIMAELEALGIELGDGPAGAAGARGAGDGESDDEIECEGGPHHLYYDRRKGWMLRVTVDVGKSVIGKRLKFRLRTRDAGEAERARDLVLATLKKLGLTVHLRMQGKQRGKAEGVLSDRCKAGDCAGIVPGLCRVISDG